MAKISLSLVFALMVSVALHLVLCEDNPWQTVIEEAKREANKAGLSDETIFGAEKAVADGTAQKAAQDVLGGGSFSEWVEKARDMTNDEATYDAIPSLAGDTDEVSSDAAPYLSTEVVNDAVSSPDAAPNEAPNAAPNEEQTLFNNIVIDGVSSPAPAPNLFDDDEDFELEFAPKRSPSEAPVGEPTEAPEAETPSEA
ncbi:unnamed protein product [Sphenostylis stenocarpa]|uniref:Uncharacterized protein n=1 Tax=Sphenostylis stenocarpa TaxID=92480 RepID=A0AA86STL9_9FABA|nr:unnamed protein product [Sphenostylis stenocarpa]